MKLNDYNLEAFRFIRLEIDNRVQTHYKMVMWKIGLGLGVLAFLIEKGKDIPLSPYMLVAIFLFLMDIVIIENLGHIRSAGQFVKNNIENYNESSKIIKWESDFAQGGDNWGCFSAHGYIFGIWIIAPLLMTASFIIDFNTTSKSDIAVLIIALYLLAYSLYYIIKELGANKPNKIIPSDSPIK